MLRNSYELFVDSTKHNKLNKMEHYVPKINLNELQMAYFIAAIPNMIYKLHHSIYDEELINLSNKLINIIESKENIPNDDLSKYSKLYSKWCTQNPIITLKHKFIEITHFIKYYKYHLKNNTATPNMVTDFELIIKRLLSLDEIYTIQLLMEHYKLFIGIDNIKKIIWDIIHSVFKKNSGSVLIILVERLKNKIIPMLADPNDRRDIYYNIDIEYLLHDMDIEILNMCVILIQHKVIKIDPSFIIKTDINIKLLNELFDILFK